MAHSPRRPRRAVWLLIAALGLACTQDFPTGAPPRFTLQEAAAWPDTLTVTDVETLRVDVHDAGGGVVTGVEVTWRSGDDSIVRVQRLPPPDSVPLPGGAWRRATREDSLSSGLGAVLTARGTGVTDVIVTVSHPRLEPVELRARAAVVPLTVREPVAGPWPDTLAVTDSTMLEVEILDRLGGIVPGLRVGWQSTDPLRLRVTRATPVGDTTAAESLNVQRRAVVSARAAGLVDVVVTVDREGFAAQQRRIPVRIVPLTVQEAGGGRAWPGSLTVTERDTIAVDVRGVRGAPVRNIRVTWRSATPEVLGVAALSPDSAAVGILSALRRGTTQLSVTVDRDGFEAATYGASVAVESLTVVGSGTTALTDSLTVTDTVVARLALRNGQGLPVRGLRIDWASTDPNALQVAQLGGATSDSARVTALRRGAAQVVAVVDPGGPEPTTFRDTVTVDTLVVGQDSLAPWPDSILIGDASRLTIRARTRIGLLSRVVPIQWRSSDPQILSVSKVAAAAQCDSLCAQLRADVAALGSGTVTVAAIVGAAGVTDTVVYAAAITVSPWSVGRVGTWPDTVTVAESESLTVAVLRGAAVDTAARVGWRSSDPNLLSVIGLVPPSPTTLADTLRAQRRAVVTGRRTGQAAVIVAVTQPGGEVVTSTFPVRVFPLGVDASVSGAPPGLSVTDSVPARVVVRNHRGAVMAGLSASWASSSPGQLQVINSGRDTTTIVGLRTGQAVVVATVDPNGTEPVQFRDTVTVTGLTVGRDSVQRWNDTLAVTDSTALAIRVTRATDGTVVLNRRLPIRWQLSRATFAPDSQGGVRIQAQARGWAVATVVVGAAPFDTVAYRDSVRVLERWTAVTTGDEFACGLTINRDAYCWGGQNQNGRSLGNGSESGSPIPVPVFGGLKFASISAGQQHACGLTWPTGLPYCWGENEYGALGDGTTNDQLVPTPVLGGRTFASLSTGGRLTCGVLVFGAVNVMCWGQGWPWPEPPRSATLQPDFISSATVDTSLFLGVTAGWRHACGITVTGNAYCWGDHFDGRLGVGSVTTIPPETCSAAGDAQVLFIYGSSPYPCDTEPALVAGGQQFRAISAGGSHACAIAVDDRAWCWGDNRFGQLGDGTITSRVAPVLVLSGSVRFRAIAAAGFRHDGFRSGHTCALGTDDLIYCWGDNRSGQLGTGSTTGPDNCSPHACGLTPRAVMGGLTFVALSTGVGRAAPGGLDGVGSSCGLRPTGAIYCWGGNVSGKLGRSTIAGVSAVPIRVEDPNP